MVPKKDDEATSQYEGIHDNPSGNHPSLLRCLENEGPSNRVEEGQQPPKLSKHQFPTQAKQK